LPLYYSTETFLTGFHGAVTGSDGHGAKLDAATALLTEFEADAEGIVYMTVFTSPPYRVTKVNQQETVDIPVKEELTFNE
jgi:hypothetical protein